MSYTRHYRESENTKAEFLRRTKQTINVVILCEYDIEIYFNEPLEYRTRKGRGVPTPSKCGTVFYNYVYHRNFFMV